MKFKVFKGFTPVKMCSLSQKGGKELQFKIVCNGNMLQTPRTLTKKTLGDRAFLAAAPKLWNG